MKNLLKQHALFVVSLVLFSLQANGLEAKPFQEGDIEGKTYLVLHIRPTAGLPSRQQKIGMAAIRQIAQAAKSTTKDIIVDINAAIFSSDQNAEKASEEKLEPQDFRSRMKEFAKSVTPNDTVIIYTHTHGQRSRIEGGKSLGGLALDHVGQESPDRGIMPWDEYAELILDIPAKKVVVLTMACFSGELVDTLNSQRYRSRWENRYSQEGRSLIVLTVQDAEHASGPIITQSEIINPFTFAVSKMFAGAADGFLATDDADTNVRKDGELTFRELIDYVVHTTKNVESVHPKFRNNSNPQVTGSYDHSDVLSFGAKKGVKVENSRTQFLVATAFLTNDSDGDGKITREEAKPIILNAYDEFDGNSDGVVDQNEFKEVAPRVLMNRRSRNSSDDSRR